MYKVDERFYPKDFEMDFNSAHRHYLRYLTALKMVGRLGVNELWLDCACGCGYGTDIISNFTTNIHGYDIDDGTINYAEKNYNKNNISFLHKFPSNKYDVIFSLETIEHIDKKNGIKFLKNLSLLLKDGGIFVITTPISKTTGPNKTNKFHKCEYCLDEFLKVLSKLNLKIDNVILNETKFTDGSVKDQGYFKLIKE